MYVHSFYSSSSRHIPHYCSESTLCVVSQVQTRTKIFSQSVLDSNLRLMIKAPKVDDTDMGIWISFQCLTEQNMGIL